jgi:hypothetical protein
LDPRCKIEIDVHPWISPFSLYTGELNLGHKTQVLLGTSWEHFGNKGKNKKMTALAPLKEKNWIVHECILSLPIACMKFLFPKLLVTSFGLG